MSAEEWKPVSISPSLATAAVACAVLVAFGPKGACGRTPEEAKLYKWALQTVGHYAFDTPDWSP